MTHCFDTDEAKKYGILAAVVLGMIRFWIGKNKANNKHCHDGHYWTYNSAKAWAELIPYATVNQVRRALELLEESGEIVSGNHNQSAYDRTKWYRLTCQIELANLPNGIGADAEPIPVENQKNTNTTPKQSSDCPVDDVVRAYHDTLPELPRVRRMHDKRKRSIVKLWDERKKEGKYSTIEDGLTYWTNFFEYIRQSNFMMGRVNKFRADIDFIFDGEKYTCILEEKYHRD